VPTGGKTVSIQTPSGYTGTLLHLGAIGVARGTTVREGAVLGTVGPSGVVDHPDPYIYFGVRTSSDEQGYVDPLTLLPPRPTPVTAPAKPSNAAAGTTAAAPASPEVPALAESTARVPASLPDSTSQPELSPRPQPLARPEPLVVTPS